MKTVQLSANNILKGDKLICPDGQAHKVKEVTIFAVEIVVTFVDNYPTLEYTAWEIVEILV